MTYVELYISSINGCNYSFPLKDSLSRGKPVSGWQHCTKDTTVFEKQQSRSQALLTCWHVVYIYMYFIDTYHSYIRSTFLRSVFIRIVFAKINYT